MEFKHLIGGKLVEGTGNDLKVYNPATGKELASFKQVDGAQATMALEKAQEAFKTWSKLTLNEREAYILKFADLLIEHRDELVDLLVLETGKGYGTAQYDFDMIPNCLKYFIAEAKVMSGKVLNDFDGNHLNLAIHKPIGVVVGYLAWNFPLLNVGYKLGPVLASGCTCVLKPSSQTPLATMKIGELAVEAGIPDGVINVLAASNAGVYDALNKSKIPAMMTLIGSTATGLGIIKDSTTSVKHYSLELGGNAPVMVMKDADVELAAKTTVAQKTENCAQVCVAPNRVFVHNDVMDEFLKIVKEETSKVVLGSGKDQGNVLPPMVSEKAVKQMQALVDDAVSKGATVLTGGKRADRDGYYFLPTVLTGVTKDMDVYKEEIFGPIMPIIGFDDSDDAIKLANDTIYGLAAYVYTKNVDTALAMAKGIDSGSVCVNEPHYNFNLPHGGCKDSGIGKDCSTYSLEEYYYVQRITIK